MSCTNTSDKTLPDSEEYQPTHQLQTSKKKWKSNEESGQVAGGEATQLLHSWKKHTRNLPGNPLCHWIRKPETKNNKTLGHGSRNVSEDCRTYCPALVSSLCSTAIWNLEEPIVGTYLSITVSWEFQTPTADRTVLISRCLAVSSSALDQRPFPLEWCLMPCMGNPVLTLQVWQESMPLPRECQTTLQTKESWKFQWMSEMWSAYLTACALLSRWQDICEWHACYLPHG